MEALALDLRGRLADRAIVRVDIAAFSALKTFDPPLSALEGTLVEDVTRHGKFLDVTASGLHLVLHLARAGWVRWREEVPSLPPRPSPKSPLAARIHLDTGAGLDITEAGTKKSLAIYVVRDPAAVEGIARLGPDPLDVRVHRRGSRPDPGRRRPVPDQGRAPAPGDHRRDRQRLLRRAPARGANVPVQAGELAQRGGAGHAVRRDPHRPRRRGRALPGAGGHRAQGREEVAPGRARPRRARPARSAGTPSARCPSPTPACSTARPARPAASRWRTAGCHAC